MVDVMGMRAARAMEKEGMPVRAACLALLGIFILAGTALAAATECPITVNTSLTDQRFPDISGNLMVWQDLGDHQIHLYNITTGIESTLVSSPYAQQNPVIDGSLVAWLESNSTSMLTDVVLYDLLSHTNKTLSVNGYSPAISGDRVVFINSSSGFANITLYYNTTGTLSSPVFEPPNDRTQLHISGEWLTWVNRTTTRLYAKNLTDGNEMLIYAASGVRTIPAFGISGDRIVWNYRPTGQWNVYIFNLTGLKVPELVPTGSGQNTNPAIDGLRIVWSKSPDIYLLDLAGPGPAIAISSPPQNDNPRISGDRVVWQKTEGGYDNVYMYTNNSPVDCPAPAFAVNPASGSAGLGIRFTDTSLTNQTHFRWLWEFGDGTNSTEKNPVHAYSSDGSYNVSLTVANLAGRGYTSVTNAVGIGPIPIVSFTSNQTYGVAPLTIQFNDTSLGNPSGWAWDFGDGISVRGNTLAEMNPVHTYAAPGTFTVSLSATNKNGTGTRNAPG
jgi:beta propeller repeat protein